MEPILDKKDALVSSYKTTSYNKSSILSQKQERFNLLFYLAVGNDGREYHPVKT